MKNHLFLFLLLTLSLGNINAQNQQSKALIDKGCNVTSNFSYTKPDCDTVNFNANATSNNSTTILGYYWTFGDGGTSTSQNPTHNYVSNGNYTVTLTVVGFNSTNGECCNDTSSQIININCGVSCGITIGSIQEVNGLGDDNVVFYAVTQLNSGWNITNSTFVVTYEDGTTITYSGTVNQSTGNPQILIPVSCTNKVMQVTVTVTASHSSGVNCSDTRTRDWSPIGVCGTGGFSKISPNPVKTALNIEIDKGRLKPNTTTELVLYNINGHIERKQVININKRNVVVDVNTLAPGMYILRLLSDDVIIDSKKIIVSED